MSGEGEGFFSGLADVVSNAFDTAADTVNSVVDNFRMGLFGENKASEGLMIREPVFVQPETTTLNGAQQQVQSYFSDPFRSY